MKEQNLWSKLNEALKKQRKEARQNSRKEGGKSIQDCFNELTPSYYGRFVCSLNKNQLLELMSELSNSRKSWLWNCLLIPELTTVYKNLDDLEVFFKNMSIAVAQKFLEGICASTLYDVFNDANHEQKEYILKLVSDEQLEAFLNYSPNSVQQLIDFLKLETYDEEKMGVLEKISKMSPKIIANFLEEADESEIIYQILKFMDEKTIASVCQHVTNLYCLIEKSDFRLLNFADQISAWDLDEAEWQDFYCSLTEREVDLRTLPTECIIEMYRSGSNKVKEDILFGILECEEMADLYYELSLKKQMEMLNIMSGRKVMRQYDSEKKLYMLESAIHILEKKEEHNSMEELYLADLKSKLS